MLIVGVDTGSKNIGIALYGTKTKELIKYEEWNPMNLFDLFASFGEFIYGNNVDRILFEKPFYTSATLPRGYHVIESIGVMRLACQRFSKPYEDVSPNTAKKRFTGSGKATKEDIHQAVITRFGVDSKSTHLNDAIAICVGWADHNG